MKLSGFTFVKNAIKYAYPLKESIYSVLPLVDEFIVVAGDSDDGTTELIKGWNEPKIKIIETIWDKTRNIDGWIYADETNIALRACSGDWCFYIQADEVISEMDYDSIKREIEKVNDNSKIEALLFRYIHFYGSYEFVGIGRQWYRREIRLVRNNKHIISWGDAQGFRYKLKDDKVRKLKAKQIEAKIYHYGWVRPPKIQGMKLKNIEQYYHSKEIERLEESSIEFDYQNVYELKKFEGNHPQIMLERIEKDYIWTKFFIPKPKSKPLKHKITDSIEKATGWRIGEYKDFIEVK